MPQAIITAIVFVGTLIVEALPVLEIIFGLNAAFIVGPLAVVGGIIGLSKLMEIDLPRPDSNYARQKTVRSTTAPVKRVYGESLVSGPVAFLGVSGTDNQDLWHVIALTGDKSESITDIYLDNIIIPNADINSGNSAGGVVNGTSTVFGPSDGTNITTIYKYIGSQTQASGQVSSEFLKWTADHKGQGLTYIATKFSFPSDERIAEIWNKYNPQDIKALVKGMAIYDPRKDSTSAEYDSSLGVSTHRLSDETTWQWSDNPALCLANYIIDDEFGMGIHSSVMDWASVHSAADYCDALVSIPGSQTQKRFTCNGVLYGTDSHSQNVSKILSSMNGSLVYSSGRYVMQAGQYIAPESDAILTDDDLNGAINISIANSRNDRFNTIKGTHFNPSDLHKKVAFPEVQLTDISTRDAGEVLYKEVELPMTNDVYMCQRLMYQLINRSNDQMTIEFPCNLKALRYSVGDRVKITLPNFAGSENDSVSFNETPFVILGFNFSGESAVTLTLLKDTQANYADMPVDNYSSIASDGSITDGFSGVPAPSNLGSIVNGHDVRLTWDNPVPNTLFNDIIVYQSDTSNFSESSILFRTKGDALTFVLSSSGLTKYYWVRASLYDNEVDATDIIIGQTYRIRSLGTTNWTNLGASSPVSNGDTFVATANGTSSSGTGVATDESAVSAVVGPETVTTTDQVADSASSVEWLDVDDATNQRPANNATVGATLGTDVFDGQAQAYAVGDLLNSNGFFRFTRTSADDNVDAPANAAAFNTAFGRNPTDGDIVVVTNTTSSPNKQAAYQYDGSTFGTISGFFAGDLIIDDTITAAAISVDDLGAINADLGTITGGTLKGGNVPDADEAPSGSESGSFFDLDGGKFVVGDATNNLLFDGSSLSVTGTVNASAGSIGNSVTVGGTAASTVASDSAAGSQAADQISLLPRADDSEWTVGTGAKGIWSLNGDTTENAVVVETGPHGELERIWKATSTDGTGADGGFQNNSTANRFPIVSDTTYRFSVFIKQDNTNGAVYLGAYNYDSSGSTIGLYKYDGTDETTNKYWFSSDLPTQGEWYLLVGFINPSNTNSNSGKGGIYNLSTGVRVTGFADWRFSGDGSETDATTFAVRTYNYYAVASPTSIVRWAHPRVDRLDRRAPSIAELLRGWTSLAEPINAGVTITGGGITMSSGGSIKGGQTDFNTGTGFFLGYSTVDDVDDYRFSIGDSTDSLVWDGSDLTITGAINATSGSIANSVTVGGTVASTVASGAADGATARQGLENLSFTSIGSSEYSPAVNGSRVTWTETSTDVNWDTKLVSDQSFTGGAFVTFVVNTDNATNTKYMLGLANVNSGNSYTVINYAIYIRGSSGDIHVYESGNSRGQVASSLNAGDVCTVYYDGNKVQYIINGSVVRTVSLDAPLENNIYAHIAIDDGSSHNVQHRIDGVTFGATTSTVGNLIEGVTITGGGITMSDGGSIKGGQTAFNTGTGFFLGYDATSPAGYKFSVGNAGNNSLTFENGALSVSGTVNASGGTFSGEIAAGSGTSVTIVGDSNYPIYSGAVYEDNLATNDPDPLAASFRVSKDGSVFAKSIDIRDSDGNSLLSSSSGAGAALLAQLSLSAGAGVGSVSGTTAGDDGSFQITTTSSVTLAINSELALNDNSIPTLILSGQDSTQSAAIAQLTGKKIVVTYEATPASGSVVTQTSEITFVDYNSNTSPSASQIAVDANYIGGSYNKYLTGLMDAGGALEYIPNTGYTGAYGSTAYAKTSASLALTAQTWTIKIKFELQTTAGGSVTSTTQFGTGVYYTGQTSGSLGNGQARRLYELPSQSISFLETAANVFSQAGTSVLNSGGTISGNLVVTGDLTVQGTTTTINVADLTVADKDITLNYSSGDSSSTANDAGIIIQDAVNSSTDASLLWKTASDSFSFSHKIKVPDVDIDGQGLTSSNNLDNLNDGFYKWGSSQPTNAPTTYMVMYQMTDPNQKIQIAWGSSGNGKLYVRRADSGTFYAWERFFGDGYHPNADKLTSSININGVAFDGTENITVADSTKLPLTGGELNGGLVIDVDNLAAGALRIEANQTNPNQDFYFAQEIYSTLSGSQETTADREQGGIYMDINSSATGGGTSHEHRAYGVFVDLDSTGDADLIAAVFGSAVATPTEGTTSSVFGGYFIAEDNGGAGNVTNVYGVHSLAISDNSDSDANNLYGVFAKAYNVLDSGPITAAYGVYGEIEVASDSGDIYGTSYVFRAEYDNNSGVEQTNTTYLFYGNYAGVLPSTAYGLYIVDAVPSYFGGGALSGISQISSTGQLLINQPSSNTTNELIVMKVDHANADQIWADNGGSIRLRSLEGKFLVYTGGDALSSSAANAVNSFTVSDSGNSTFGGTVNIIGDGDDLIISSDDQELVLIGNRGSTGTNLDAGYLRMKAQGVNKIILDTEADSSLLGGGLTVGGNLTFGDESDISMAATVQGQAIIKGNGYTGGIALNATAMHIYHNSSSRGLIFGTNETQRVVIDGSGTNTSFYTNIALTKTGTADTNNRTYNSQSIVLTGSGWDTNNNVARNVEWTIKVEPVSSVYPDADLMFYEPNGTFAPVVFHGRGSTGYADPKAASFFGNVTLSAGTGTGAGLGELTTNGRIVAYADVRSQYAGNSKVISESQGDFFPGLEIIRSSGSSKTNYHWLFQLGSTGFLNIKDNTNSYYPVILKDNGDVALSNDTDGLNPVLLLDHSANSANFDGAIEISGTTVIDSSRNVYANYSLLGRSFRSTNRGELHLNATGTTDVSEIFFGYGDGYISGNIRWGISDRGTTTGTLVFYKGPANNNGSFEAVANFSAGDNRFNVVGGYDVNGTTVIDSSRNLTGTNFSASGYVQATGGFYNNSGVTNNDGPYDTISIASGGSGFTDGTYNNVAVSGGSYGNMQVIVSGGTVTEINKRSGGYHYSDATGLDQSANLNAAGAGSGSGFTTNHTVKESLIHLYANPAVLRFTMADASSQVDQEIGSIRFATRDSSADGAGDVAQIVAKARSTSGGGYLDFLTSNNGGEVYNDTAERLTLRLIDGNAEFSGAAVFDGNITVGATVNLSSDAEHYIGFNATSPVTGATADTTVVNGRQIDLYAYDDVQIRAGTSDKVVLTAGGAERLQADSTGVSVVSGALKMGSNEVIDTGRNITSGTIDSGVINVSTTNVSQAVNIYHNDTTANVQREALKIDYNVSGADTLTADRPKAAIYVDMDVTATGGDTSNEVRAYGLRTDVRGSGDSDLRYGVHAYSETEHSSGTVSANAAVYGLAVADDTGTGHTANCYGGQFLSYGYGTGTGGTTVFYGSWNKVLLTTANDKNTNQATGVYAEVEVDNPGQAQTLTTAYVVRAEFDNDSADNVTITNSYLFYGNYSGTLPNNAYGVYIGDNVRNYFGGSLTAALGSTTTASYGFNGDLNTGMYSPANHEVGFLANGTQRLKVSSTGIDVTGDITASGNVTAFSDERLKDNIKTLDGSKVLQMRGVSFTKDGRKGSGVIAQELEQIASELVLTAKDEMGTKSVAYGNLVGYLIENAKQQQSEIDELKDLIKKLMEK